MLVRTDGAGTHEFLTWLTGKTRRLGYSVGFPLSLKHAAGIATIATTCWTPAYDADGNTRDGAWVADATGVLDLAGWPKGMLVIVRKERPHPGAQPNRPIASAASAVRHGLLATAFRPG